MATLYFQLEYEIELYASAADKKDLKKNSNTKIDAIVLIYEEGGPGFDIEVKDFIAGADLGFSIEPALKTWAKGVAKVKPKADLARYLERNKNPEFFFHHVTMNPWYEIYGNKKSEPIKIKCVVSETKPK